MSETFTINELDRYVLECLTNLSAIERREGSDGWFQIDALPPLWAVTIERLVLLGLVEHRATHPSRYRPSEQGENLLIQLEAD